jgi:hypothetical protein
VVGRGGHAVVTIQKGSAKPDGGFFPDKNSIKDYVMIDRPAIETKIDHNFNDPIPF